MMLVLVSRKDNDTVSLIYYDINVIIVVMSSQNKNTFSANYQETLQEIYDPWISDEMPVDSWRYADIPSQPSEKIAYVRLNEGASDRPVIYIPGFTEGIISKAPFAADLAQRGFDVVLPDQNRKGISKDPLRIEQAATYSQALNYLAVIEAEKLGHVDVVTHSYGSLILDSMVKIADRKNQHFFDGSRVIMLAPGGFNEDNIASLSIRFAKSFKSEGKKHSKSFPAQPEMLAAGIRNFKSNIPRSVGEVSALLNNKVDYLSLLNRLGSLTVLSYAKDKLYSQEILYTAMEQAVAQGVDWAIPITLQEKYNGYEPDATHNDEQFNPSRVAASVAQILRGQ